MKLAASSLALALAALPASPVNAQPSGSLTTLRADHTALRVADFEASIAWYRDKLGFREDVRWQAPRYLGGGIRLAYLRLNDVMIEIAGGGGAFRANRPPSSIPALFEHAGWNHLCLRVDDLDAALAELRLKGVEVYAGPNTNPTTRRRFAHILDNSGNPIELVQYPSEDTGASR